MGTGRIIKVAARLRSWSDLPYDILYSIADRLTLLELLSFRGVCKNFRLASSGVSAETGSENPWLLDYKYTYGAKCIFFKQPEAEADKYYDISNCKFFNQRKEGIYIRNIPDLEGATCLASYQGWLLLLKDDGKIFFLCPFSLAKITLPDLPHKDMDGYVGVFSDIPTSSQCIVSVAKRSNKICVKVYMISKGESGWTRHKAPRGHDSLSSTIAAARLDSKSRTFYYYMSRTFYYYISHESSVLTFSLKDNQWKWKPYVVMLKDNRSVPRVGQGHVLRRHQGEFDFEDDGNVAVCRITKQYQNPLLEADANLFGDREEYVVVWVQPRFFQVDPNEHWYNV